MVDPSRGQQRGRDAGLAFACTLTRKLAWLHVVHPIKGNQSAQAVREGLPCHPSAPAVASRRVMLGVVHEPFTSVVAVCDDKAVRSVSVSSARLPKDLTPVRK